MTTSTTSNRMTTPRTMRPPFRIDFSFQESEDRVRRQKSEVRR
jgi:hypothetical protein